MYKPVSEDSGAGPENPNPKICIPNQGSDPEQIGMSLKDTINTLLAYLHKSAPGQTRHSC